MELMMVWILNALALLAVTYFVPNIHVANFTTALIAALLIGLVNMLIRPVLVLLTLPITILTLGLFIFVINAAMLSLTARWSSALDVRDFWTSLLASLIISLVAGFLGTLFKKAK